MNHCLHAPRTARILLLAVWSAIALGDSILGAESPQPPSFHRDVMAVLSKAGCNAGVCHGNKNGKGGFKLSLRGEDPAQDFLTLTREQAGRRINPLDPEASLILRKATLAVSHAGGLRFARDSLEYTLLRDWIAAGARRELSQPPQLAALRVTPPEGLLVEPADRISLRVEAVFRDGSRRDVTRLAVYEPSEPIVRISADGDVVGESLGETTVIVRYLERQTPVRLAFVPARPDFRWTAPEPANFIDRHVFARLRSLRIHPAALCDDTAFLRRAYFDLLGIPPSGEEARRFAADASLEKRSRLVDGLLERAEFADFWGQKWSDLLRNEERTLDRKGVENFYAWIRQAVARDVPLDQFARELIASRGSTYTSPAANYYRAMRDPFTRAESTAQLFLGVRLQCARCHNHPFDRWTQDDYYGWANWFARVDYKILENRRLDRNDEHEFDGEQIVFMRASGDVANPRTGAPAVPRFLHRDAPAAPEGSDRLLRLSEWITSAENRQFAHVQANRIWYHLLGRGIVHPIDDFRETNPPSNPELLDALAEEFARSSFRLKPLIRHIMNSHTYQAAAQTDDTNGDDQRHFSHALVRRLAAEQLLDAFSLTLDVPLQFSGYPDGLRAGQLPGVRAVRVRDQPPRGEERFLQLFGKPPRLQPCECERSSEASLNQAFQLISGPLLNDWLTRPQNRLGQWLQSGRPDAELIDELYWTALSRPPASAEVEAAERHLRGAADRRRALEDIAWAVLNSNEFLLRR